MDVLGERLARIRHLLSDYQFDKLLVCMLGDVNDGTEIYAGQAHEQAESNVEEQAYQLATYMSGWLKRQKDVWGNVEVEAVPGNHGRAGRFAHVAANWDLVAYRYMKLMVEPAGITVNHPMKGEMVFLRKITVRKHPVLLYHGHDLQFYQSVPWYGIQNRLMKWSTVSSLTPFELVLLGHLHFLGDWSLNMLRILASGCMPSDDDWPVQKLGYESQNKWWLFGMSNKRPVTWQFGLELSSKLD
jgi:hypothetical protein